jgi:hypothetical protein
MRAPASVTVREAAGEWLAAAEAGLVRTRSGSSYKPSALRSYEEALRTKLLPELGHLRLWGVSRNCAQDLADRLVGEGFTPSSVRNAILPLRAIYRRALDRGDVAVNPTLKLSLPALRPGRERVARATEAAALIAALPHLPGDGARPVRRAVLQLPARANAESPNRRAAHLAEGRVPELTPIGSVRGRCLGFELRSDPLLS